MKVTLLGYTVPCDGLGMLTIEHLLEEIGRVSHASEDKMGSETTQTFLKKILKLGHDAMWEFADVIVLVEGVSRAMTHQLVRHRLVSYMQESQRHVSPEGIVIPESIRESDKKHGLNDIDKYKQDGLSYQAFDHAIHASQEAYNFLISRGVPKEDARFVLPNATQTRIVVKANLREWMHILKMRGSPEAQWEIREFAIEMLKILKDYAPTVFGHYRVIERDGKKIIVKGLVEK